MNLLVKKAQRVIILKSETIKDYPVLAKFLKTSPNHFAEEIHLLDQDVQSFFCQYNIEDIAKQASAEWKEDKEIPITQNESKEKKHCEFCGQRIKQLYHIVNVKTKEKLQVGSECIYRFGVKYEDLEKQKKLKKEISRKAILNENFPDIEYKLANWGGVFESLYKFTLLTYEDEYNNIGTQIKVLQNKFIFTDSLTKAKQSNILNEISDLFKKSDILKKEIKKYNDENLNNRLVPSRKTIEFLKSFALNEDRDTREHYSTALKWLMDDKIISYRVLPRLNYNDVIKDFLVDIKTLFNTEDLSLISYSQNGYIFKFNSRLYRLKLFIPYPILMKRYSKILLGNINEPIDINFIIDMCSVVKDVASYGEIISNLLVKIESMLKIHDFNIEFDELYLKNEYTNVYYRYQLSKFVKDYKKLILKDPWLIYEEKEEKRKELTFKGIRMNKEEYLNRTKEIDSAYTVSKEII